MPNLALVDYVVVGAANHLDILQSTMEELQGMDKSFLDNYYGKTWLGNLIVKLGGDPFKCYCRGEWTYINRYEDYLVISMETAWGEPNEVREFLENTFPGLKIYFQSVTDDSWQTNDKDGLFYFDRYVLYTDEHGEKYYPTLEEVIEEIESITGIRIPDEVRSPFPVISVHSVDGFMAQS